MQNFFSFDHNLNDSIVARLDKVITDFKDKYKSPGVSVCLVHENDIVYSNALGYTNIEHKTPASIDSKFPIMSVTKTFTATMLMQLAERGKGKLDDDVRKYVPEYKIPATACLTSRWKDGQSKLCSVCT